MARRVNRESLVVKRGAWRVERWTIVMMLAAAMASQVQASDPVPGTAPLTMTGDPAALMVAGIDRFLDRQTELSLARRSTYWKRDFSSAVAYERSLAPNRARLRKILGVVDERLPCKDMEILSSVGKPAIIGDDGVIEIRPVRWQVLPGVDGEGLLLSPKAGEPSADCIILPDCETTPEALVGFTKEGDGSGNEPLFVRLLAHAGVRVLVPTLINRHSQYSVIPGRAPTGEPHREWIYRQAFEMGRHIQGYEIQKVLAAAEWFRSDRGSAKRKLGLVGFGEGGVIALAAGAMDTGIDTVGVSAAFHSRQKMWEEPIDHNVWGFLKEFGDAELAAMIAPRSLTVEAALRPSFFVPAASQPDPRKARDCRVGRRKGGISTFHKAGRRFAPESRFSLIELGRRSGPRGSMGMCIAFLESLRTNKSSPASTAFVTKATLPADFAEQRQSASSINSSSSRRRSFARVTAHAELFGPRPIANRVRRKPGKKLRPGIAITCPKRSSASSTSRCYRQRPRADCFTNSPPIVPMK